VRPDEAPLAGAHWRVADLPPGFTLARTQRSAQDDDAAEHQVYADGLASVSLYIEPRAKPGAADLALGRGMLNIYTHEGSDYRVAALGDVPRATLERMARSIQPIDAH
jgi:sigma-E factor negative regulatory protein RseB